MTGNLDFHANVSSLADCLQSYSEFLIKQCQHMKVYQSLDQPVRQISELATVEYRNAVQSVGSKYLLLDNALKQCPEDHLLFDEELHLEESFQSNMQRARY